jgi:Holliday junction resolvasome RuvABC endonuclease subunit
VRAFGVDIGLSRANPIAWALLDIESDRLIAVGMLAVNARLSWEERIPRLAEAIKAEVSDLAQPDVMGFEMAYLGKSPQVAIKLSGLIGALLLIAYQLDVPGLIVQPAEAANALLGHPGGGRDEKKRAAVRAVQQRYNVTVSDHEADAIAVALHAGSMHRQAQWYKKAVV